MSAGSLHTTPAPTEPADVVEHPNLANYYNLLDAAYEILKLEQDPNRRLKVEECRTFTEGVIASFEEPDTTAQQPAPPPMTPPMPMTPPPTPMTPPPTPPTPPGPTGGGLPGLSPPGGGDQVPAATPQAA